MEAFRKRRTEGIRLFRDLLLYAATPVTFANQAPHQRHPVGAACGGAHGKSTPSPWNAVADKVMTSAPAMPTCRHPVRLSRSVAVRRFQRGRPLTNVRRAWNIDNMSGLRERVVIQRFTRQIVDVFARIGSLDARGEIGEH